MTTTSTVEPRDLVEVFRRARVEERPLALRAARHVSSSRHPAPRVPGEPAVTTIRVGGGRTAHVTFDAHNGVAEIDGGLTLPAIARRLARLGAVFPLARPLPPLSLASSCAALPFFVDAWVQQASGLTFDGDEWESPRAPRAAAGPSLLGALCARPPLAIALRARVRVLTTTHAFVVCEQHPDVEAAARRVRDLLEEGRAFSVDAFGLSVLVLSASALPPKNLKKTSSSASEPASPVPFAHLGGGRRACFSRSESLVPGDAAAMAHALAQGSRVVGAPLMGRAAALRPGVEPIRVLEVSRGARELAEGLAASAQSSSSVRSPRSGGGVP